MFAPHPNLPPKGGGTVVLQGRGCYFTNSFPLKGKEPITLQTPSPLRGRLGWG